MGMDTGGETILGLLREVCRVDIGEYGNGSVGYAWVGCGGYLSVEGELYFEQTQNMQMMFHWSKRTMQVSMVGLVTKGW